MKPYFIIEKLRGTLFVPQVACDWEFVSAMQSVLHNAIPSLVKDSPQVIDNILFNSGEWILNSKDDNVSVVFKAHKIDCIVDVHDRRILYTEDALDKFIGQCSDVMNKIVELKDLRANRMAIAPTFKYCGNELNIKGFVLEVFNKNNFKGAKVDNCDFSQVFRIEERILEEPIMVNYLSKFFTSSDVVVENGSNTLRESRFLNLDINTAVNPEYMFAPNHISDFFKKANGFCSEFMKWYFTD